MITILVILLNLSQAHQVAPLAGPRITKTQRAEWAPWKIDRKEQLEPELEIAPRRVTVETGRSYRVVQSRIYHPQRWRLRLSSCSRGCDFTEIVVSWREYVNAKLGEVWESDE